MKPIARAIDHLVINVRDVETTARWYERVLGMTRRESKKNDEKQPRVSLEFGAQKINVRPVTMDEQTWFTARNASAGSDDICFLTDLDPDSVLAHLRECDVPVELGPVQKSGAVGPLTSVYCRDPDGNLIEISSYARFHGA